MSDMLNEKFEEFASEHAAVLSEAGQDPMPTVTCCCASWRCCRNWTITHRC